MIIVEKENESDSETEFLKKTKLRKQEPRIKLNDLKVPKSNYQCKNLIIYLVLELY